jgi:hypothetical protein
MSRTAIVVERPASAGDRAAAGEVIAGESAAPAHPGQARPGAPARARARRSEIGRASALLALLAALLCAGHVRHGGLYYDDWSLLALRRFPPAGGLLHGLWLYYGQRPGQVLYYAALYEALGTHVAARLALAALALVGQATVLFALLRRLGLQARDAFASAALSLAFPFSDSVWLWGVLSLASLAIAASLLGVLLALRAFESGGRRSLALHACSLALYVSGVLSYEIFAVAGCLAGLLYMRAVGFARARMRWAVDVLAIAAAALLTRLLLPIDIATPSHTQTLTGALEHAAQMLPAAARLAGSAMLPVRGLSGWAGFAVLLAVVSLAAAARMRLPARERECSQLSRWVALAAGGAVLAVAGWLVYVPASGHYLPSSVGTVNRVNALAAIGIALLCYSSLMLLARGAARAARLPAEAGASAALVLAALLCVGYVRWGTADARSWDRAASDQRAVLAGIRATLAHPPRGATIFAFDAPLTVGPGVPVLNTRLDLTSALRVAYASPSLEAVPLARAGELRCAASGPIAGGAGGRYGRSYLLDVRARRVWPLLSASQCESALSYAPGAAARSAAA